jgi:hypothetical protein
MGETCRVYGNPRERISRRRYFNISYPALVGKRFFCRKAGLKLSSSRKQRSPLEYLTILNYHSIYE